MKIIKLTPFSDLFSSFILSQLMVWYSPTVLFARFLGQSLWEVSTTSHLLTLLKHPLTLTLQFLFLTILYHYHSKQYWCLNQGNQYHTNQLILPFNSQKLLLVISINSTNLALDFSKTHSVTLFTQFI